MKIAVYHNLPTGGAKRILFEQVKYLSKKHDIDVYTLSLFKESFLSLKSYSKNYYIYDFKTESKLPFILARLYKDYKNFISLRKLHRKIAHDIDSRGYDLAFIHTDVLTETPYLLRFLKIPKVYYCEELLRIAYEKKLSIESTLPFFNKFYENIIRKIRKSIDKNNAQAADLILTSSNFMKDKINKAYKRNSVVCYPGVDCNSFKTINVKKENQILFMGNKIEVDGYNLVLNALKEIPKKIRPFLKVLSFSKNGPIIKNDLLLAKEYSKSILTICADISEPFGLKVLESLACGTPVVAVNEGGYKETLKDKITGFLVERNSKAISKKIMLMIKKPKQYKQFSLNSRKDMLANWQWEEGIKLVEKNMMNLIKKTNKNSNILISYLDSGGIGGAEFFPLQLAKSLESKHYKTFFITYKNSKIYKIIKDNKIKAYITPFRMDIVGHWKGIIKFFVFLIPSLFVYSKILRDFKQNLGKIILISGFSDKILLTPIAKYLGIKTIWIEYADPEKILRRNFGIPKFLYDKALKYSDEFIVPTKYLKDKLCSNNIFKDKDIKTIPCGIEVISSKKISIYKIKKESVKKKLKIEGKKVIGMISRLEKGKGQDILLKTIPLLKKKLNNFIVVFAGEGNYKELKILTNKLQIQDYVKFLGFYKDKYELMSTFDVFVFPTKWELEGFGLVSLEAMLMEVPLITSDIEILKEVVGDSALLSEITTKNLSKNIIRVFSDKGLRQKLIKSGTIRVNSLYNIDKIADEYIRVIRSI
jgi:glycosyltransferase involved in cell wall biosynthesis